MRVFWNVLKNDLARTVCSKAFIFAALGLTAATFLTGMDELSYMTPENDLIYIVFAVCGDTRGGAVLRGLGEPIHPLFGAAVLEAHIRRIERHCVLCLGGAGGHGFRVARSDDLTALGISGGEHGNGKSNGAGRI